MDPLVSVIVPVYKVETYLNRCIESIAGQTYKNLEVILVDDGSPDQCPDLCDEWAKKDSRIRVIHQKNAGIAAARNTGLEIAGGAYLMFVDSDDYLSEIAIELLQSRIVADGSDMAMGKRIHVYEDGRTKPEERKWMLDCVLSPAEIFGKEGKEHGQRGAVEAWGKLYKRKLFYELRYTSLACGEDLWVYPFLIEKCTKISILNEEIYYYYHRAESITQKPSEVSRLDEIKANLHYGAFLLNGDFWAGTQKYFAAAIDMAWEVNNTKEAIKLFRTYYPHKERKKVLRAADLRIRLKWMLLQLPWLQKPIKWAKHSLKGCT